MDEILGLDRSALDRARISRDARFDGKFFIAVTSTGIYCRPICPSPTSKNSNVRYYATAAAAAEAGFRPCLRCRPEAAPGTPGWLGTSAVVRRALRLIQDGALDEISVDDLAARIGIGLDTTARIPWFGGCRRRNRVEFSSLQWTGRREGSWLVPAVPMRVRVR